MLSNLYTFKELLGKGQFGEIWKAEHKYTKETYAIKQNITSQNVLLHECKVMQFLQTHKNIPKLKWYGAINKHPSLIIEFISYDSFILRSEALKIILFSSISSIVV